MTGLVMQGGYSSSPMDYLNSFESGSLGGVSGGSNSSSGLGGMSQQQILQIVEELLAMLQQALQGANSDDSDDGGVGGASGAGGGGGSGGGMPSMPSSLDATPSAGTAPPSAPPVTPSATPASTGGPAATTGSGTVGSSPSSSGLSTAPQTAANTPEQSQQVAGQYVNNLMQDFNLTKPQAEGIVANLWHESGGMNSGINQGGAIGQPSGNMADDNANGYGIAQWGGSRKEGLINYAKQNGLDPSSQAANYGYLKQELETTQSGAISAVKNTSTAQDATQAFCDSFEKPSDPEMSSRLADLALVQNA
ncbi:phage tail tip lysozyme [Paraburkholderia caffeinilytica]|uniref:phage tail tip lysozyme n=1 Tax=Paraburkholderia caffeinilytica TaxID=1761016 RepID=UPI003DA177AF